MPIDTALVGALHVDYLGEQLHNHSSDLDRSVPSFTWVHTAITGLIEERSRASRLYEEAVVQARNEQRAVQDLGPDGTNSPPSTRCRLKRPQHRASSNYPTRSNRGPPNFRTIFRGGHLPRQLLRSRE